MIEHIKLKKGKYFQYYLKGKIYAIDTIGLVPLSIRKSETHFIITKYKMNIFKVSKSDLKHCNDLHEGEISCRKEDIKFF